MGETRNDPPEIIRWYTPARRLQKLVGKAPGGGYYPGGPYPISAIVGAGVVLMLLSFTKGRVWSTGHWVIDSFVIPCGFAAATLFGLKQVKPGGRNPLSAAWALVAVVSSPGFGTYQAKRVSAARTHRVRHNINAQLPTVIKDAPAAQPAAQPVIVPAAQTPTPQRVPAPRRVSSPTSPPPAAPPVPVAAPTSALSGIQRRLAQANKAS